MRNTTGLDGLQYEISEGGDWTISTGSIDVGTVTVDLTEEDVARVRDTYPFSPALDLQLARRDGTESYSLNFDGEIEASVQLVVVADVDYTFHLVGDQE